MDDKDVHWLRSEVEHERELRELWEDAHEKVHALGTQDLERRLEAMNKLREQVMEERGQFVPRLVYDEQLAALRDAVDIRLKLLEQGKSNLEGRFWMMGAVISGLVVVVNLALRYFGGK